MRRALVSTLLFACVLVACKSTPPTTLPRGHSNTFNKAGEFRIGEGDILEISSNVPKEAPIVVTVNLDGFFLLPLVGEVQARGTTLRELSQIISKKYEPFVKNPRFVVNLREMRSYKVFVYGEAKQNGEYQFTSRASLLGAIAKAGGPTDYSSGRISIFRRDAEGQKIRFDFSMDDVFREEASGEPMYVERSDIIVLY